MTSADCCRHLLHPLRTNIGLLVALGWAQVRQQLQENLFLTFQQLQENLHLWITMRIRFVDSIYTLVFFITFELFYGLLEIQSSLNFIPKILVQKGRDV